MSRLVPEEMSAIQDAQVVAKDAMTLVVTLLPAGLVTLL